MSSDSSELATPQWILSVPVGPTNQSVELKSESNDKGSEFLQNSYSSTS